MEKKNLAANHKKERKRFEVPLPPPDPSYETLINHKNDKITWSDLITLSATTLSSKTTTQIGSNANYWEANWEQNKT